MDTKEQEKRLGQSYLTVAQAAEQLGVHPSTIRRWIDAGILRAHRLGPKRIALMQSELQRVVVPRTGRKTNGGSDEKIPGRVTKAERQRRLKILAEIDRFRAEMAAKYGKLEPEAWVLINEMREERTQELMEAIEGKQK